jgi:hypothetical protein
MKGLGKNIIETILKLDPDTVIFDVKYPTYVSAHIHLKDGNIGSGLAICSTIDEFDERKGKNLAAGRAIKALLKKEESEKIRQSFPGSWRISQAERLRKFASSVEYKSKFFRIPIGNFGVTTSYDCYD